MRGLYDISETFQLCHWSSNNHSFRHAEGQINLKKKLKSSHPTVQVSHCAVHQYSTGLYTCTVTLYWAVQGQLRGSACVVQYSCGYEIAVVRGERVKTGTGLASILAHE